MEQIILIDGTVLDGHIIDNGDGQVIFVYLNNMSIVDGFNIFSNKERIKKIIASSHGEEFVYNRYTELFSISHEFGNCNIALRRE